MMIAVGIIFTNNKVLSVKMGLFFFISYSTVTGCPGRYPLRIRHSIG